MGNRAVLAHQLTLPGSQREGPFKESATGACEDSPCKRPASSWYGGLGPRRQWSQTMVVLEHLQVLRHIMGEELWVSMEVCVLDIAGEGKSATVKKKPTAVKKKATPAKKSKAQIFNTSCILRHQLFYMMDP